MSEDQNALIIAVSTFNHLLYQQVKALNDFDAKNITHEGLGPDTIINTGLEHQRERIMKNEHLGVALDLFLRWYRDTVPLKSNTVEFRPAKEFIGRINPYEMIGVQHIADTEATRLFLRFNESGNAVCLVPAETEKMMQGKPFDRTITTTWERIRKL